MFLYYLGEQEKAYWDRLNQQRIDRRNGNIKKSKRNTNKKGSQKVGFSDYAIA